MVGRLRAPGLARDIGLSFFNWNRGRFAAFEFGDPAVDLLNPCLLDFLNVGFARLDAPHQALSLPVHSWRA